LFFTLVEAIAHMAYPRAGSPGKPLHVIVLDCYLLTGATFAWAAASPNVPRLPRLQYLLLNTFTLGVLITTYGLNIHTRAAYFPTIIAGCSLGIVSSLILRRSWKIALGQGLGWIATGLLVARGDFRTAVYWTLCCVYLIVALKFQRRLKPGSTGRLALITGFYIWAICFLVHPWIIYRIPAYAATASHVWNMQKWLIVIGMLLLMLERQVEKNQWLARHDELTGLPNRRFFEENFCEAVDHCRRTGGRIALFMLDLNGFKKINDALGHDAGDQVIRAVGAHLEQGIGSRATMARLGGDEFVILLCDPAGDHSVARVDDMIRRSVERPVKISGQTLSVTASVGVSLYPEDTLDFGMLVRIADQRMYALKHRAKFTVGSDMDLEEPALAG
jgi:diguanylate cyclase (GGDEF)-like protein